MQLLNRIENCNGCGACVVGCKYFCVKMLDREDEEAQTLLENAEKPNSKEGVKKVPRIDENGCSKCNNCVLFCPIFNPIDMPLFDEWLEYDPFVDERDMAKTYRAAMRDIRAGKHTEFIGTLCQIAGLISLLGNKIRPNMILKPMVCSGEKRETEEACRNCIFY